MTYEMHLSQVVSPTGAINDVAYCDWNSQRFHAVARHGVTMALARMLVDAGAPDGHLMVYRRGKPCLAIPRMHKWAKKTIEESDSEGLGLRKFKNRPTPPGPTSLEAA